MKSVTINSVSQEEWIATATQVLAQYNGEGSITEDPLLHIWDLGTVMFYDLQGQSLTVTSKNTKLIPLILNMLRD